MSVHLVEIGSPAFEAILEAVRTTTAKLVRAERTAATDDEWLTTKEAMAFLKVKSREKIVVIRNNPIVKSKLDGGVYKYEKASLIKYLKS